MCPFCLSTICEANIHTRKYIMWWKCGHIPNTALPTSLIHVQWHEKKDDNKKIQESERS